jgi:serine/threonine protein kinase
VIKYSEYYCEEAHILLARHGLAPRLHLISHTLDGNYRLVIMDRIQDCETLADWCKRHDYVERDPKSQALLKNDHDYQLIIGRVEEAVKILHDNSFVFGDLRSNNILVRKKHEEAVDHPGFDVYLIDFDWTGKADVDEYRIEPNRHIRWHEGVHVRMKLRKAHDELWLRRLKDGDWWSSFSSRKSVDHGNKKEDLPKKRRESDRIRKREQSESNMDGGPSKKMTLESSA